MEDAIKRKAETLDLVLSRKEQGGSDVPIRDTLIPNMIN